jgi:hypothetical protein
MPILLKCLKWSTVWWIPPGSTHLLPTPSVLVIIRVDPMLPQHQSVVSNASITQVSQVVYSVKCTPWSCIANPTQRILPVHSTLPLSPYRGVEGLRGWLVIGPGCLCKTSWLVKKMVRGWGRGGCLFPIVYLQEFWLYGWKENWKKLNTHWSNYFTSISILDSICVSCVLREPDKEKLENFLLLFLYVSKQMTFSAPESCIIIISFFQFHLRKYQLGQVL